MRNENKRIPATRHNKCNNTSAKAKKKNIPATQQGSINFYCGECQVTTPYGMQCI